jgi:hypothetical protein
MAHYKRAILITPETLDITAVINCLVACYGDTISEPPIKQSAADNDYYRVLLHNNSPNIQASVRDMQVSTDFDNDHQNHPELMGHKTTLLLGGALEEETHEILTAGGYALKNTFAGNLFILDDHDAHPTQLY